MGLLDALKAKPVAPATGVATQNAVDVLPVEVEAEKGNVFAQATLHHNSPEGDSDDELVHKGNTQWGVQKAEAMCQVWGKKSLFAVYGL